MPALPTYKASDVLAQVKGFIKSMPIDGTVAGDANFKYKLVDEVCSIVWVAAPWWWTLGTIGNVSLSAGVTDYTITVPTDFLYLLRCTVSDGSQEKDLKPVAILPANATQVGVPEQAAVVAVSAYPTLDTLRIHPKPTAAFSGTANLVYKRQPPTISSSNWGTAGAMVLPDCYLNVIFTGCLWLAYWWSDDARAGTATVDEKGNVQYTQALGVFQASISQMRKAEKLLLEYPGMPILNG